MSDETPRDDTPTERFPTPAEQQPEAGVVTEAPPKDSRRGMMIALIAIASAILLALIVLIAVLLGGGDPPEPPPTPEVTASESPSPTPSPTPEESESPEPSPEPSEEPSATAAPPPPAPTGPAFTTFSPKTTVTCSFGGPSFTPPHPPIEITWASARTASAWIVQGTSDAANSGFMQIPVSGNQSSFEYTLEFPCFQATSTWTITLVGTDGTHLSRSWTVTNNGDKS